MDGQGLKTKECSDAKSSMNSEASAVKVRQLQPCFDVEQLYSGEAIVCNYIHFHPAIVDCIIEICEYPDMIFASSRIAPLSPP